MQGKIQSFFSILALALVASTSQASSMPECEPFLVNARPLLSPGSTSGFNFEEDEGSIGLQIRDLEDLETAHRTMKANGYTLGEIEARQFDERFLPQMVFRILSAPPATRAASLIAEMQQIGVEIYMGGAQNGTLIESERGTFLLINQSHAKLGRDIYSNSMEHEAWHARLNMQIISEIDSLFDVEIANLPGQFNSLTNVPGYESYLNFQELATHQNDIELISQGVPTLDSSNFGESPSQTIAWKRNLISKIRQDAIYFVQAALKNLSQGRPCPGRTDDLRCMEIPVLGTTGSPGIFRLFRFGTLTPSEKLNKMLERLMSPQPFNPHEVFGNSRFQGKKGEPARDKAAKSISLRVNIPEFGPAQFDKDLPMNRPFKATITSGRKAKPVKLGEQVFSTFDSLEDASRELMVLVAESTLNPYVITEAKNRYRETFKKAGQPKSENYIDSRFAGGVEVGVILLQLASGKTLNTDVFTSFNPYEIETFTMKKALREIQQEIDSPIIKIVLAHSHPVGSPLSDSDFSFFRYLNRKSLLFEGLRLSAQTHIELLAVRPILPTGIFRISKTLE